MEHIILLGAKAKTRLSEWLKNEEIAYKEDMTFQEIFRYLQVKNTRLIITDTDGKRLTKKIRLSNDSENPNGKKQDNFYVFNKAELISLFP